MRPSLSQAPALIIISLSVLSVILAGLRPLWLKGRHVLVRQLSAGLLAGWLVGVLLLTLSGIDRQAGGPVFNVIPFRGDERSLTETLGNILMFVPGGVILAVGWSRRASWWLAPAGGAAISLCIEITQGLSRSGRAADITDVILNSMGTAAGYLMCAAWIKTWPDPGDPTGDSPRRKQSNQVSAAGR